MFGDRLTHDQSTRLVYQLAQTRLPFQCAHGRPSLVPLTAMGSLGVGAKSKGEAQARKVGRRRIDWGAWRDKHA
jgi:DNA mismatch repair protein MLH3